MNPIRTIAIVALAAAAIYLGVGASVHYFQHRQAAAAAQIDRQACQIGAYCNPGDSR